MAKTGPRPKPQAGREYPKSYADFLGWFPDDVACIDYLDRMRWPANLELILGNRLFRADLVRRLLNTQTTPHHELPLIKVRGRFCRNRKTHAAVLSPKKSGGFETNGV